MKRPEFTDDDVSKITGSTVADPQTLEARARVARNDMKELVQIHVKVKRSTKIALKALSDTLPPVPDGEGGTKRETILTLAQRFIEEGVAKMRNETEGKQ